MTVLENETTVHPVPLPAGVCRASGLLRLDYTDSFAVRGPQDLTAEHWARQVLEDAPGFRYHAPLAWRLLGLRVGPIPSTSHVLGWEIRHRTDDLLVLGLGSRLGMPAELFVEREGDAWVFGTLLCFRNPAMRALWSAIRTPHQRVVQQLLDHAAARCRSACG